MRVRQSDCALVATFALVMMRFDGCGGIACLICKWADSKDQCMKDNSVVSQCKEDVEYCQIGMGVRVVKGKHAPVMSRNCNDNRNVAEDNRVWAKLPAGYSMVCTMVSKIGHLSLDRKCICRGDKCNSKIWDETVVQPVLPSGFANNVTPEIPTLGTNSMESILTVTQPTTEDRLNVETLVGIIAGAVAGLLVLSAICCYFCTKDKEDFRDDEDYSPGSSTVSW